MKDLVTPIVTKTTRFIKITRSAILPFKELPAKGKAEVEDIATKVEMNATELFSFFTADIIREQVSFTR